MTGEKKEIKMNKEVFYVSNLITLSRFILLFFTAEFLLNKSYFFSIVFIILIWISDLLDGYFARSRNEVSELGKIIDPLADKIVIAVIILILLLQGILPLWFMIITILRDIIIFTGGLYLKYKKKIVLQSNWTGKLTVFTIGFTVVFMILIQWINIDFSSYHIEYMELLSKFLILLCIVMSVLSLGVYTNRFLKEIK